MYFIGSKVLKTLKKIITKPIEFPENYLSARKQTASAEYFVERLLNPGYQKLSPSSLSHKFVLVEVGPKKLPETVDQTFINFEVTEKESGVTALLTFLGR